MSLHRWRGGSCSDGGSERSVNGGREGVCEWRWWFAWLGE